MNKELITNNTGISIKSWLIYITIIVGILILLVVGAVILIDGIFNKSLQTNLEYIPPLIDSVRDLIFVGAVPKIVGEGVNIFQEINNKLNKKT